MKLKRRESIMKKEKQNSEDKKTMILTDTALMLLVKRITITEEFMPSQLLSTV